MFAKEIFEVVPQPCPVDYSKVVIPLVVGWRGLVARVSVFEG